MKVYLLSMMTYFSGRVEHQVCLGTFSSIEKAISASQEFAPGIAWRNEPDIMHEQDFGKGYRDTIENLKDVYYGGAEITKHWKILVLKMWIAPFEVDHYELPR